jgi:teichuronic acid biosynthesis glycosyltransferase TuaH
MGKLSFLFLGASSPWTYGLAEALAQCHFTHAVQFYDWQTYHLNRSTWPTSRVPPSLLQRSVHVLPTGYAGRLEKLFRFYLQQLIQRWCQQLKRISSDKHPWVIAPHPFLAPWVRKVPTERLIYYNFDDYVLYRPSREKKILEQEKELIERATVTLCSSNSQLIKFQKRHPHRASYIYHFPHGFVSPYLNPQPENPPEPMTVGYVGNLGDRLDWQLIYQVVKACPNITFVFVGGRDDQEMIKLEDWQADRETVLALSNVRHIGKVPSDQVAKYYWSFALSWIPYVVNHKFNQAACPTKIMDGIASGRPVISTDIPECRLYPEWIKIFYSAEDAIALIHEQLAISDKPEAFENSLKQLDFARQHTWQIRAQNLENLLLQI